MSDDEQPSKLAPLFLYAAIVQGGIAAFITFLGAFGAQLGLYPVALARVLTSTEAGIWFTMGYSMYIIVGVVAMAVTSLFYFVIESVQGHTYRGTAKVLAWAHLVLANIGIAGTTILAMIGGYQAGATVQPTQISRTVYSVGQVSVNVLQYYQAPIAGFLGLALLGFVAGGFGYVLSLHAEQTEYPPQRVYPVTRWD